ncbi:MAG TPA: nucleoside/nucleotide kinase family protein [Mycobacteriales bacterium]|nr:nucleoside/nucleotide kinase family protein [Mycobacteriales bacterium]
MTDVLQVFARHPAGGAVVIRGDVDTVRELHADLADAAIRVNSSYGLLTVAAGAGPALLRFLGRRPSFSIEMHTAGGPQSVTHGTSAAELEKLVQEIGAPRPASDVVPTSRLVSRVRSLAGPRERVILGLTGVPGAGKSTLAADLAEALGSDAIVVPMDGFHLGNRVLREQNSESRKGAIDTFDVAGYRVLLERLRARAETVYAPMYVRDYEETIAASITVEPSVPIVITEGNYLLAEGWERVRALLDEVWYVEVDEELRLERLIDRHIRFGKPPEQAIAWATGSDERNARLIRSTREQADLIVRC